MKILSLSRRRFLRAGCITGAAGIVTCIVPKPVFASLSQPLVTTQETRLFMGTIVTITVNDPSKNKGVTTIQHAFERMEELIAIFNRHDSSTPLGVLNSQQSLRDTPLELVKLLKISRQIGQKSDGYFNPAVLPLLEYYSAHKTNDKHLYHSTSTRNELLELTNQNHIKIDGAHIKLTKDGMKLTLDGIAKGYIVDAAAELLSFHGIQHFLVNAGGDIRAMGCTIEQTPWKIGIAGSGQQFPARVIPLKNAAIATSGNSEQFFDAKKTTHHLLNPFSGTSPQIKSISAIAPNAMLADALATTIAVTPQSARDKILVHYPQVEYVLYTAQGACVTSSSLGNS